MREEINRIEEDETEKNLRELCIKVKRCCRKHDYITGEKMVMNAMGQYPDAAQPHNLFCWKKQDSIQQQCGIFGRHWL